MPDLMMPEGANEWYARNPMPGQSLTAYRPTLRDQTAQFLQNPVNRFWRLLGYDTQDQRPSPERAGLIEGLTGSRGMGTTRMGLLDATPAGVPFAVQDAYRAGDDRALAMAIMPGPAKGVTQEAKAGIRAYHGSPHDFDRFDMSKIGTGEGAQAYGHGLYFAENDDVARQYLRQLANADATPGWFRNSRGDVDLMDAPSGFALLRGDRRENLSNLQLLQSAEQELARAQAVKNAQLRDTQSKKAQSVLDYVKNNPDVRFDWNPETGRLYEVRINASPDDFLDWDKPLSAQSEKARSILEPKLADDYYAPDAPIGQILQKELLHKDAVQPLRDAGIPGIKYLDQGSRGNAFKVDLETSRGPYQHDHPGFSTAAEAEAYAKQKQAEGFKTKIRDEGSRNYVVFRDDIIDIVRKYGIAAAASMYGMDAVNDVMGKGDLMGPVR